MEVFLIITIKLINFLIPFLIGSLIFFSAVIAPTTFSTLDSKSARKFVRTIFPKLYLWSFLISIVLALLTTMINTLHSIVLFIISIGFLFSRQFLTKWINDVSDIPKKNSQQASRFNLLHTLSVIMFITQIILLIIIYFNI